MASNITCPSLNPPRANKYIVTAKDIHFLVLTTERRTVGTSVHLSCQTGYSLTPSKPDIVKCQSTQQWDYSTKPECVRGLPSKTATSSTTILTPEEKIIVGVTAGVGGIILIVLFILIFCVKKNKLLHKDTGSRVLSEKQDFNNTESTELNYDSWRKNYLPADERPRLGLTPVTVPSPNYPHNPYNIKGQRDHEMSRPGGASSLPTEPPQDYDVNAGDNSQPAFNYGLPRHQQTMYYHNKGFEANEQHGENSPYNHTDVRNDYVRHEQRRDTRHESRHEIRHEPRRDIRHDIHREPRKEQSREPRPGFRFDTRYDYQRTAPGVDSYRYPDNTHTSGRPFQRWSSLEFLDGATRENTNKDRMSRTFDANDSYLWRPMASAVSDRGYFSDHRI